MPPGVLSEPRQLAPELGELLHEVCGGGTDAVVRLDEEEAYRTIAIEHDRGRMRDQPTAGILVVEHAIGADRCGIGVEKNREVETLLVAERPQLVDVVIGDRPQLCPVGVDRLQRLLQLN